MSCCEIKASSKVWNNTNRAKILIVSLTIKSTIISLDWIQVKKIKFIVFYSIVTSTRRTTREMGPLEINLYAKIEVQVLIIFKFKLKFEESIEWPSGNFWPSAYPFPQIIYCLVSIFHDLQWSWIKPE